MTLDAGWARRVRNHLTRSAEVKNRASEQCVESILEAASVITAAFRSGGKLLLCGNGGSAADCQHMATEFVSSLTKDSKRPPLPAIALTTDSSFLTAFSNDYGFDYVFERQVYALGNEGDILIGISTSGNSTNVIRAVEAAKKSKMMTVALTGEGGHIREIADVCVAIPSSDTQHIQEAHLAVEHVLCDLVERQLFGGGETGIQL